jgi:hypothetical protein
MYRWLTQFLTVPGFTERYSATSPMVIHGLVVFSVGVEFSSISRIARSASPL